MGRSKKQKKERRLKQREERKREEELARKRWMERNMQGTPLGGKCNELESN